MKKLLKENLWFLIPYSVVLLVAVCSQISIGKINIHILLNSYHTTWLDVFFKNITVVGAWFPLIIIAFYLLFVSVKMGSILAIVELVASSLTSLLKSIFNFPRPSVFLASMGKDFPLVDGVSLHITQSFPSGHTTACFALFFTLAIFTKNRWLKLLCFLGAIVGSYSRIYLSQHFMEDVIAGSLIALVTTIALAPQVERLPFGSKSSLKYMRHA